MSGYVFWLAELVAVAILAVFVSQGAAMAQTVQVRTGEHADFTRIVIDFTQRPGWRLGRNAGRYELWLENSEIRFGLGDAFRRLQGRRVAGLTDLGQGRLSIELLCDCALSVDLLPNQGLLIDVRDAPPARDNPWTDALVLQPLPPLAEGLGFVPVLPLIFPRSNEGFAPGAPVARIGDPLSPAAVQRIQDLQTGLVEQAARAASQGLITFAAEEIDRARESLQGQDAPQNQSSPAPPPSPPALAANIRIETQYDRDNRAIKGGPVREQTFECLSPDSVDVGDWFDSQSVFDKLGEARMNLVDARDRADPQAYETLARMLIYLTFGREARAVLEQGPAPMPDRDILMELARAVDGGEEPTFHILPTQMNCDTTGALWSLLTQDDTIPRDLLNTPAVVRELSAFPAHLRQHLGPRLAEKLMDMGEREAALSIRNAIRRGGDEDGPEVTMLQARLDQAAGNQREANVNLAAVAKSRSEQAALALGQLIESRIRADQSVSEDMIQQAMAMVFELGKRSKETALPRAIIAARAHSSQFERALQQIDDFSRKGHLDLASVQELRGHTLEKLATFSDDVTFLTIAVAAAMSGMIGDPVRLPVAARLVGLGLAAPARAALGARADIPGEEERYILAEIAVLEGKRNVATSYLTGLVSDRATELQNRAEAILPTENSPSIAETGIVGDFEPIVPKGLDVPVSDGTLAQGRELLEETKVMRVNLLALLAERTE